MYIDTIAYGRLDLPVLKLYGKILIVQSDLDVTRRRGEVPDLIREGEIFAPRWDRELRSARYAHYRSIFDLSRACAYALAGWGSFETGELAQVMEDLDHVRYLMGRLIGYGSLAVVVRKHLDRKFAELKLSLKGKSDVEKARARELLLRAADLMDGLGRLNPGKSRMQLAGAAMHLGRRRAAIGGMQPHLARRGTTLAVEADSAADVLWSVRNRLDELIKDGRLRAGSITAAENALARREIEGMVISLKILRVQPFLALRNYTVGDLERAGGALLSRHSREAHEYLETAYNGVRSKLAAIWLEPHHLELGLLAREMSGHGQGVRGDLPHAVAVRCRETTERLVPAFRKFRDQLGLLDDAKFVEPVFKRAREGIALAIDQLGAGHVPAAKESVKLVCAGL